MQSKLEINLKRVGPYSKPQTAIIKKRNYFTIKSNRIQDTPLNIKGNNAQKALIIT